MSFDNIAKCNTYTLLQQPRPIVEFQSVSNLTTFHFILAQFLSNMTKPTKSNLTQK